jgi:hypothetical protein
MAWDHQLDDWPRALTTFRLKPSQTALLIIDVQRYCADPSIGLAAVVARNHPAYASYAFPRLKETVLPNIARLITLFRERGLRIVFLPTVQSVRTVQIFVLPADSVILIASTRLARRLSSQKVRLVMRSCPRWHLGLANWYLINARPAPS